MEKIRLQKLMAERGIASRRKSEELILGRKVKVNGVVAKLGQKIDPEKEKVSVNGRIINTGSRDEAGEKVYLMVNKPVGFVTTVKDDQGRKTVMELVTDAVEKDGRLFPVGRLDIETSGLLFLTNDGDWAQKVIHPSKKIWKTYWAVTAGGEWSSVEMSRFKSGLRLGAKAERLTAPAEVKVLERYADGTRKMEIKVMEGQNHQVRRMCAAVNKRVLKLERVAIGKVKLGELGRGKWRKLTEAEVKSFEDN